MEHCTLNSDWLNEDLKMDSDMVLTLTDLVNCITIVCQSDSSSKVWWGGDGVLMGSGDG